MNGMFDRACLCVCFQVDWTETWLLVLLAFHVVTLVTILLLRRQVYVQAMLLAVLGELISLTSLRYQLTVARSKPRPNPIHFFSFCRCPLRVQWAHQRVCRLELPVSFN